MAEHDCLHPKMHAALWRKRDLGKDENVQVLHFEMMAASHADWVQHKAVENMRFWLELFRVLERMEQCTMSKTLGKSGGVSPYTRPNDLTSPEWEMRRRYTLHSNKVVLKAQTLATAEVRRAGREGKNSNPCSGFVTPEKSRHKRALTNLRFVIKNYSECWREWNSVQCLRHWVSQVG